MQRIKRDSLKKAIEEIEEETVPVHVATIVDEIMKAIKYFLPKPPYKNDL